jgi:heme/copper-type cytochrome/quinol oxidase subunit 2
VSCGLTVVWADISFAHKLAAVGIYSVVLGSAILFWETIEKEEVFIIIAKQIIAAGKSPKLTIHDIMYTTFFMLFNAFVLVIFIAIVVSVFINTKNYSSLYKNIALLISWATIPNLLVYLSTKISRILFYRKAQMLTNEKSDYHVFEVKKTARFTGFVLSAIGAFLQLPLILKG